MSISIEVAKKPETVSELVKNAWVSPQGKAVPDYAYPLVKKLKENLESHPGKSIAELSTLAYVDSETCAKTLSLIRERLKYLNNGIPTTSLLVLPLQEYNIFEGKGVYVFPHRKSLAGTAGEAKEIESENAMIFALQQHVKETFEVKKLDLKKVESKIVKKIKKQARLVSILKPSTIVTGIFGLTAVPGVPILFEIPFSAGNMIYTLPGLAIIAGSAWAHFGVIMREESLQEISRQEDAEAKIRQEHEEQPALITSYLLQNAPALDAKGNLIQERDKNG